MNNKFTVLDGAMGTMIQNAGLPAGASPELWNIEHPEIIIDIHKKYIAAGSDIIYANTFGANRHKLKGHNVTEVITAAVKNAKKAAEGTSVSVALDIGPIGQLLEPLGTLKFDEAYDIFSEMVKAGYAAGADLIVFETMSDLYEAKAAVLAAKENTPLPVWVTMTFEKNARTFLGVTIESMALTLSALGVDALGFNCSLGPFELFAMAKELAEWTSLPIILKPNAGLPDPESGKYTVTPDEFSHQLALAGNIGVSIMGGCCGTSPDFIKSLAAALKDKSPAQRSSAINHGICSPSKAINHNSVAIIGERINPTGKKRFQDALKEQDFGYILSQAISQEEAGSDILDVNVGLPGIDEPSVMKKTVVLLQTVTNLPLMIDSSNPAAIENALRYYNGKCIVNSVNGESEILDSILPLVKKYGAAVVGLTMDKNGIPETCEERIKIARTICDAAFKHGIPKEDIIIDCLTLTVSAQQNQAQETLKALRYVSEEMQLSTTLGVSNISFGLPEREIITTAFLTQALASGLKLPIINPNQASVINAVFAHRVLNGIDRECYDYISRFVNIPGKKPSVSTSPSIDMTIDEAVCKGFGEEVRRITSDALDSMSELEVVDNLLIPALDAVGTKYENQQLFLPQLINAANAAQYGFEAVRESIAKKGGSSVSKGKILIATVKGDIHDIGKNIVKVVLQNYGYSVIDLGRDVEVSEIVDTVINENITLVGLSALMTTTVAAMEETIKAVKNAAPECKIWVGGAVLTEEYAKKIGADYYAKDAKQSADIAKSVFGGDKA